MELVDVQLLFEFSSLEKSESNLAGASGVPFLLEESGRTQWVTAQLACVTRCNLELRLCCSGAGFTGMTCTGLSSE